jgi:hypothetical protein
MKSLFAILLALAALNVPDIAPEEEVAPPAIDAPAEE